MGFVIGFFYISFWVFFIGVLGVVNSPGGWGVMCSDFYFHVATVSYGPLLPHLDHELIQSFVKGEDNFQI